MTTTETPTSARDQLETAADRLDALLAGATAMPWRRSPRACDAIVGPISADTTITEVEGYDGALFGESMSSGNRALVLTFGALAGPLAAFLRELAQEYDEGQEFAPQDDDVTPMVRAILDGAK